MSLVSQKRISNEEVISRKPIGTHAHEWFVYRGDLGIALTDTYTTSVFFKQFDKIE